MRFWVAIRTGNAREYGPRRGWDDLFDSRAKAEACATRARLLEGWSAKVMEQADEAVPA